MVEKQQLIDMVLAAQRGDAAAATALYDACHNAIYTYILSTVNDVELAADLTQNAFMEIFMTIRNLQDPSAFLNWSKQIAYHRCTAYYRKRRELLADEIGEGDILDNIEEERKEFIPGESMDEAELKKAIRQMINNLPEEQRSAILMRYFEELSVKEIATLQGVSEGTIKSRLNYGRKAIKKAVESYERKHNIKLRATGAIPLMLWTFRQFKVSNGLSLTARVASDSFTSVTEEQAAAVIAGTTTASAGTALTVKIAAGVAAVAVTVGGISAAVVPTIKLTKSENLPENILQATVATQTDGLSMVLNVDGTGYEVRGVGTLTGTQIVIPDEFAGLPVTSIGAYAFVNCENITTITLPDSITSIGEQAFSGCTKLTAIAIPGGVTSLSAGAFYGCTALAEVTLSEGLTAIGGAAFAECTALEKLVFPATVAQIGAGAFNGCTGLKGLSLPANLSNVGEFAFIGCTGVEWITVAAENTTYHSVSNCLIETESKSLILGCKTSRIPSDGSINQIAPGAFAECAAITEISIPTSVTLIASTAFYGCSNLTDIHYAGTMSQWDAVAHGLDGDGIGDYTVHCADGKVYQGIHQAVVPESYRGLVFTLSDDATYYQVSAAADKLEVVTIPATYQGLPVSGVTFFMCENLTSVTLPDSISVIEAEAFAFCSALKQITLPAKLIGIDSAAFRNTGLTAITIPTSLLSLGKGAFKECHKLTDIHYGGTMAQWNAIAKGADWDEGTGLYTVHCADGDIRKQLPPTDPEGSVGLLFTLNDDGVTYRVSGIGTCTDSHVVIPGKYNGLEVTVIEEEAFYSNVNITGITIPASVTSIGLGCFGENPKLETLIVESGNPVYHSDGNCIIETASKILVIGCKGSQIPDDGSVTQIDDYAFYASEVDQVFLPDSIIVVGHYAFANCFKLESVRIPAGIGAISSTFHFCRKLTDITFGGTVAQWGALEKEQNWDYETGNYTVHCADGDVEKA